ncbi:MAG: EamA family transporter [Rhodobacterales bacterium]|nr:MAG: EamA family transporter [Rhodobacterales bacterium]
MERRDHIDTTGALALTGFALLLGFNQVVIKLSAQGIQPVFMAGLRSVGAVVILWLWLRLRARGQGHEPGRGKRGSLMLARRAWGAGLLAGLLFTVEFVLLYLALDWTSVARASIIFYSMPVHLALAAHFLLPGERLTGPRVGGLLLAMAGVAWVLARPGPDAASLWGDLAALGAAIAWAGIALVVRITPLADEKPEPQLMSQLVISAVLLLAVAPLFGPVLRNPTGWHVAGIGFQIVAVASFGYLLWLVLMKLYPASGVASFAFLSPVFGVLCGWLILSEPVGVEIFGGLGMVALGLVLINRRNSG